MPGADRHIFDDPGDVTRGMTEGVPGGAATPWATTNRHVESSGADLSALAGTDAGHSNGCDYNGTRPDAATSGSEIPAIDAEATEFAPIDLRTIIYNMTCGIDTRNHAVPAGHILARPPPRTDGLADDPCHHSDADTAAGDANHYAARRVPPLLANSRSFLSNVGGEPALNYSPEHQASEKPDRMHKQAGTDQLSRTSSPLYSSLLRSMLSVFTTGAGTGGQKHEGDYNGAQAGSPRTPPEDVLLPLLSSTASCWASSILYIKFDLQLGPVVEYVVPEDSLLFRVNGGDNIDPKSSAVREKLLGYLSRLLFPQANPSSLPSGSGGSLAHGGVIYPVSILDYNPFADGATTDEPDNPSWNVFRALPPALDVVLQQRANSARNMTSLLDKYAALRADILGEAGAGAIPAPPPAQGEKVPATGRPDSTGDGGGSLARTRRRLLGAVYFRQHSSSRFVRGYAQGAVVVLSSQTPGPFGTHSYHHYFALQSLLQHIAVLFEQCQDDSTRGDGAATANAAEEKGPEPIPGALPNYYSMHARTESIHSSADPHSTTYWSTDNIDYMNNLDFECNTSTNQQLPNDTSGTKTPSQTIEEGGIRDNYLALTSTIGGAKRWETEASLVPPHNALVNMNNNTSLLVSLIAKKEMGNDPGLRLVPLRLPITCPSGEIPLTRPELLRLFYLNLLLWPPPAAQQFFRVPMWINATTILRHMKALPGQAEGAAGQDLLHCDYIYFMTPPRPHGADLLPCTKAAHVRDSPAEKGAIPRLGAYGDGPVGAQAHSYTSQDDASDAAQRRHQYRQLLTLRQEVADLLADPSAPPAASLLARYNTLERYFDIFIDHGGAGGGIWRTSHAAAATSSGPAWGFQLANSPSCTLNGTATMPGDTGVIRSGCPGPASSEPLNTCNMFHYHYDQESVGLSSSGLLYHDPAGRSSLVLWLKLWLLLLCQQPLVVYGTDPAVVSRTVFGLQQLLLPLKYASNSGVMPNASCFSEEGSSLRSRLVLSLELLMNKQPMVRPFLSLADYEYQLCVALLRKHCHLAANGPPMINLPSQRSQQQRPLEGQNNSSPAHPPASTCVGCGADGPSISTSHHYGPSGADASRPFITPTTGMVTSTITTPITIPILIGSSDPLLLNQMRGLCIYLLVVNSDASESQAAMIRSLLKDAYTPLEDGPGPTRAKPTAETEGEGLLASSKNSRPSIKVMAPGIEENEDTTDSNGGTISSLLSRLFGASPVSPAPPHSGAKGPLDETYTTSSYNNSSTAVPSCFAAEKVPRSPPWTLPANGGPGSGPSTPLPPASPSSTLSTSPNNNTVNKTNPNHANSPGTLPLGKALRLNAIDPLAAPLSIALYRSSDASKGAGKPKVSKGGTRSQLTSPLLPPSAPGGSRANRNAESSKKAASGPSNSFLNAVGQSDIYANYRSIQQLLEHDFRPLVHRAAERLKNRIKMILLADRAHEREIALEEKQRDIISGTTGARGASLPEGAMLSIAALHQRYYNQLMAQYHYPTVSLPRCPFWRADVALDSNRNTSVDDIIKLFFAQNNKEFFQPLRYWFFYFVNNINPHHVSLTSGGARPAATNPSGTGGKHAPAAVLSKYQSSQRRLLEELGLHPIDELPEGTGDSGGEGAGITYQDMDPLPFSLVSDCEVKKRLRPDYFFTELLHGHLPWSRELFDVASAGPCASSGVGGPYLPRPSQAPSGGIGQALSSACPADELPVFAPPPQHVLDLYYYFCSGPLFHSMISSMIHYYYEYEIHKLAQEHAERYGAGPGERSEAAGRQFAFYELYNSHFMDYSLLGGAGGSTSFLTQGRRVQAVVTGANPAGSRTALLRIPFSDSQLRAIFLLLFIHISRECYGRVDPTRTLTVAGRAALRHIALQMVSPQHREESMKLLGRLG